MMAEQLRHAAARAVVEDSAEKFERMAEQCRQKRNGSGYKGQGVCRHWDKSIQPGMGAGRGSGDAVGNRRLRKRIMNGYLWSALILAALAATLPIAAAWLASRGSRGVGDVRTMFLAIAVATLLSLPAIACGIIGLMI
jgi:hypothetical protein